MLCLFIWPVDTFFFKELGKRVPVDELLNETFSLFEKTMAGLEQAYDRVLTETDLPLDGSAEMIGRERARFRQRADARKITWAMTDALVDYCFSNDGRRLKFPRVDQMLSMFPQRPSREVLLLGENGEGSRRYDSDDVAYETDRGYWGGYWRQWQLKDEALAHRFKCNSLFAVCLAAVEYASLGGYRTAALSVLREDLFQEKRKEWGKAEADFADLLFDLREKRRSGSITEQQMLDELTHFHERIKRRK